MNLQLILDFLNQLDKLENELKELQEKYNTLEELYNILLDETKEYRQF